MRLENIKQLLKDGKLNQDGKQKEIEIETKLEKAEKQERYIYFASEAL